uniref:Tyrosinase copper-binding domain-containing protein n=1 Tax=Romanomermis culicivorax TaxID=13658 RepID=A0A915I7P6_ROMCU
MVNNIQISSSSFTYIKHCILPISSAEGPSNGFVNMGPFANFRTPDGFLSRNCQGNRTIRPNDIRVMQSLSNYTQCCYCVSSLLELIHGTIHTLVNGIMNNLNRASFDPCFWMHHSFVDKLYEDLQATWKIKPSHANFTAPACLSQGEGIDGLSEPMLPFGYRDKITGKIVGLKNQDGLQARFTKEDYSYAPSPNCINKTCTGKYLVCDANVCKSRIRNGGRCDQRAVDAFTKNGTNFCLDGYQCRRNPAVTKYKILKWRPYKVHIVQKITEEDKENQLELALDEIDRMDQNPNYLGNLFFSDEAHFHIGDGFNRHNGLPQWITKKSLHSPKTTV